MRQILNLTALYVGPNPGLKFDQWYGHGSIRAGSALNLVAPPNVVIQNSLQANKPLAYLLIADSTFIPLSEGRTFKNVPGLPATYTTSCWKLRLRGSVRHGGFDAAPKLWVRPSASKGWRDTMTFDHSFEVPWARVVSIGTDSSSFETYVYRIPVSGAPGGESYFPEAPPQARVAFTTIGVPRLVAVEPTPWAQTLSLTTSPNPGRRGVWVDFVLPREGWTKLSVWDVTGRNIATLSEGRREGGPTRLWWSARGRDGRACAPGVYWLRAEFEGSVVTRRLVLLGG